MFNLSTIIDKIENNYKFPESHLDISFKNVNNKGAKEIAKALKVNTTLHTLDLIHNTIGAKGAQALAEALKVNTKVSIKGMQYKRN